MLEENLLNDPDALVRAYSAVGLRHFGAESKNYLVEALSDPDERVVVAAARSLADIGANDAAPALSSALKRVTKPARIHIVKSISELDGQPAVDALLVAAGDEEPDVRRRAVMGLESLDAQIATGIAKSTLGQEPFFTRVTYKNILNRHQSS